MQTTIYDELNRTRAKPSDAELDKRRDILRNIAAYKALFQSEAGQMVYQHLMRFCRVYQETLDSDNMHLTARNEGMRKVGLMIRRYVKRPMDEFIKEYGVDL